MTARLLGRVALLLGLALVAGGCKFDGAYDLPLPGSPVDADHSYEVTAEFATSSTSSRSPR